jgi:hypothetical protein
MTPTRLQDRNGNDVNQFILEVQKGDIPGARVLWRTGNNPSVSTSAVEDLWPLGGTYNELDGDTTLYLWSSDGDDIAVEIKVTGLSNGGEETVFTTTLTGSTVITVSQQFSDVCQMEVIGSVAPEGTVYLSRVSGSTTAANVVSLLAAPYNVSRVGRCTIPKGYTGYVFTGSAGGNATSLLNESAVNVLVFTRQPGEVFHLIDTIPAVPAITAQRPYLPVKEGGTVKTSCIAYDSNNAVNVSFGVLLLDNSIYGEPTNL